MAALSSTSQGGWGTAKFWPVSAVIIGLGGGFALGRSIRPVATPPDTPIEDRSAAVPGAGGDPLAASAQVRPGGAVAGSPAGGSPASKPGAGTPATPGNPAGTPGATAKITAHFSSNPPGALVTRTSDGAALGTTPFNYELAQGSTAVRLQFSKKGYDSADKEIVPQSELTLAVDLAESHKKKKKKAVTSHTTIDPFK